MSEAQNNSPVMPLTRSKRRRDDEETEESVQKRQRLHDGSPSQNVDTSSNHSSSFPMAGTSSTSTMTGAPAQNANTNMHSSLSQQGSSSSSATVPPQGVASSITPQHANHLIVPARESWMIGGQQVTVLTDVMQVPSALSQPGLAFCGLTPSARRFFESRLTVPFDSTRGQKYCSYNDLQHVMRIQTVGHAQQYRASIWKRAAPYADPTLPAVRANDAYNAERWYNAAIDLTQMRDNLGSKGKGASRFTQMAGNGRPHYSHKELTGLYFRFMDVVADGTQNGFRVSTNVRHQKQVRRKLYDPQMTAHDRLEDALQAIRNEKAIFSDLLGTECDGNMVEFAFNPRAYADIKNEDRRSNLSRALPQSQRKRSDGGQRKKKSDVPDSFPWSEMPAGRRPACVYQAWNDIPSNERLTTAAAAVAFFQSTIKLSDHLASDPTLPFFCAYLDHFAHLLYDSVVSSCGMQDNGTSNQAKAFTSAPPEYNTGDFEAETRNIQAWCYRICEMLADGATYGYLMPQMDGQTPIESSRHTLCSLSQVFYGEQGHGITVFQRFGAVQMALFCSKAIASSFRGEVEDFLRLRDLLWEPLAYAETKLQHRKSNNKRKAPGMSRNSVSRSESVVSSDAGSDALNAANNGGGSSSGTKRKRQSAAGSTENQEDASSAQPQQKRARRSRSGSDMDQADVQPDTTGLDISPPRAGMEPDLSGSAPTNTSGMQYGMQSTTDYPHYNTDSFAPQVQIDPTAAPLYPAFPPYYAAQPYNGVPAFQPEGAPSVVATDPISEEKWAPAFDFSLCPVDNFGNFEGPPVVSPTQAQGFDSEAQSMPPQNIHTNYSQPPIAEHLIDPRLLAGGDATDVAPNMPPPKQHDDGNDSDDSDENSPESLAEYYSLFNKPEPKDRDLTEMEWLFYVYNRNNPRKDWGIALDDDFEPPPRLLQRTHQTNGSAFQLPAPLPDDYDWGFVPCFAPDLPTIDPEVEQELVALHDAGVFLWPSLPDEPLESGSLPLATTTMPQSFSEVAPVQNQTQPDDGSDADAECEIEFPYDSGDDTVTLGSSSTVTLGSSSTVTLDSSSTVTLGSSSTVTLGSSSTITGTPASDRQTPGTDYSDAIFGSK